METKKPLLSGPPLHEMKPYDWFLYGVALRCAPSERHRATEFFDWLENTQERWAFAQGLNTQAGCLSPENFEELRQRSFNPENSIMLGAAALCTISDLGRANLRALRLGFEKWMGEHGEPSPRPESEACSACGETYPHPIGEFHTNEECLANQAKLPHFSGGVPKGPPLAVIGPEPEHFIPVSAQAGEHRAVCLDPEKMHGFADQFGGTDDPTVPPLPPTDPPRE